MSNPDIEAELPEDFAELTPKKKVEELKELKKDFEGDTDSGMIKKRMLEELIRKYSSE